MSSHNRQRAEYGCILLFIFLCLLHIFSRRPLWLDENFVYESIRDFSFSQLFGILKYNQLFPRVHLVLLKALSAPFQYSVTSVRMISMLAMPVAFIVWRRVFKEVFADERAYLLALLTFVCSYPMTYYVYELKPYAADVLIAGLFAYALLNLNRLKGRDMVWQDMAAAVLLPGLIFFSYAGCFVFWLLPYQYARLAMRKKALWPLLLVSGISSLCAGVGLYFSDLRIALISSPTYSYWDSYFVCSQSTPCFLESFWEGVRRLATFWYGKEKIFMQAATFLIPFFIYGSARYGFVQWIKDRLELRTLGSIGAVILLELFGMGVMKKYPFTGERITLFIAPFVFYFTIRALMDIRRIKYVNVIFIGSFVVLLIASCCYTAYRYFLYY